MRLTIHAALHDTAFWRLAAAFVVQCTTVAVMGVYLVAMLIDLGHNPLTAATLAGGLGILSVTGRLATTGAQRRWPTETVVAVFGIQGLGVLALLPGRQHHRRLIAVLAIGLGFGVATIARPALLAARYGTLGFATISSALSVPLTVVKALVPVAAGLMYESTGSYGFVDLAPCWVHSVMSRDTAGGTAVQVAKLARELILLASGN